MTAPGSDSTIVSSSRAAPRAACPSPRPRVRVRDASGTAHICRTGAIPPTRPGRSIARDRLAVKRGGREASHTTNAAAGPTLTARRRALPEFSQGRGGGAGEPSSGPATADARSRRLKPTDGKIVFLNQVQNSRDHNRGLPLIVDRQSHTIESNKPKPNAGAPPMWTNSLPDLWL